MWPFQQYDKRIVLDICDCCVRKNVFGMLIVNSSFAVVTVEFPREFKNLTVLVQAQDGKWYPQARGNIQFLNSEAIKIANASCTIGASGKKGKYHVVAVAAHIQDPVSALPEGVPHSKVVAVHRKK